MKHNIVAFLIAGGLLGGCASSTPRVIESGGVESITTMTLDIADLKAAAQRVTGELLTHPSITQFAEEHGRKPRLDVGAIINMTRERFNIRQVSERVTEELLNSGQITLVSHDLGAVQANNLDNFVADTRVNLADQADYYLEGTVLQQSTQQGNRVENTYTFQLRLNDRSRNQVWKRSVDITKAGSVK